MANKRDTATSTFHAPGFRIVLLPALPKAPTVGTANAVVSNQWLSVGLFRLGFPTTLGRSAPPPVRELSVPTAIEEYDPVAAVKMVDSCQLPRIRCAQIEESLGVLTTEVKLNACRWSAKQLAYSACRLKGSCPKVAPFRATSLSVRQCDHVSFASTVKL